MGAADVPTPGPARRAVHGAARYRQIPPKFCKFFFVLKVFENLLTGYIVSSSGGERVGGGAAPGVE
jgi:hypothetical protein